jgi:hypothetical protein
MSEATGFSPAEHVPKAHPFWVTGFCDGVEWARSLMLNKASGWGDHVDEVVQIASWMSDMADTVAALKVDEPPKLDDAEIQSIVAQWFV